MARSAVVSRLADVTDRSGEVPELSAGRDVAVTRLPDQLKIGGWVGVPANLILRRAGLTVESHRIVGEVHEKCLLPSDHERARGEVAFALNHLRQRLRRRTRRLRSRDRDEEE